jgi:DNA-binding NtrC family response regulator
VVDDPYVSGLHGVIERVGTGVVVRDRGSKNGTVVGGVKVRTLELTPGTCVRLGDHALVALGRPRRGAAPLEQLAGRAEPLRHALGETLRAARMSASFLMQGESGSGKELFARLAHEASPRAGGPFVAVDCGAIPRELIESELFGHEKGAFTGAAERRTGVFQQAHGGSLFLDEIGELAAEHQARLLRVLETRRVRRVGGVGEEEVDVRVLSATHRDLRGAATRGGFRLDLFHRLCGFEVRLPPLRDRADDLPLLLRRFLVEMDHDGQVDDRLVGALRRYHWPGNVRELRHAVQRAALLGSGGRLGLEHLIPERPIRSPLRAPHNQPHEPPPRASLEQALLGRSLRQAAALLGVPRSTLHDRVRRMGIPRAVRRAR